MSVVAEKSERLLEMLEQLLEAAPSDLPAALSHVADLAANELGAEKVDAFLYDDARSSLVAVGTSTQPLSALQKRLGLDVLPTANGGRAVETFLSGKPFVCGHVENDPLELRGTKEALGVRSHLAVPVMVGDVRRGVLLFASQRPEVWTEADLRFAESLARWMGLVAHRTELVEAVTRNATERGRRAVADELMTVLAHDLRNYIAPIDFRLRVARAPVRARSAPGRGARARAHHQVGGRAHGAGRGDPRLGAPR